MIPEIKSTLGEVNTCGVEDAKGGINDDVISLVTGVVIDVIVVNN